ncbi:MAG: ABC transporter substrate-binding protein [Bacteroidota bacterium]
MSINLRAWLIICFAGLLLFSCKSDSSSSLYQTGPDGLVRYAGELPNVVRVALPNEPRDLHPTNNNTAARTQVLTYCFEGLLSLNVDGELLPLLATELPETRDDGLTQVFTLDPQAQWPSGRRISAQDVLFSFKALAQNPNLGSYLESIASIEALGEAQVEIRFKYHDFLNSLVGAYGYVLDREKFDSQDVLGKYSVSAMLDGENAAYQDPAVAAWVKEFKNFTTGQDVALLGSGSGPYEFAEWNTGEEIRLRSRDTYWAKGREGDFFQQGPDEIVFKFVPAADIPLSLKQQQVDFTLYLGSQSWQDLRSNSPTVEEHYSLDTTLNYPLSCIILNNRPNSEKRQPLFTDARVRRAIAHAIPVESIIQEQLVGLAQPTGSPVPADNKFYKPDLAMVSYDPAEARRLLTEAGWVDSNQDQIRDSLIEGELVEFKMDLYRSTNSAPEVKATFDRIKDELRQIGVEVNLTGGQIGEFFQQTLARDFDAGTMQLPAGSTPYDFKPLWTSSAYPGFNFAGFLNEEVDSLVEVVRKSTDEGQQIQAAHRVQQIIHDEMPVVYLFRSYQKSAIHRRFNAQGLGRNAPYLMLNTLRMIPAEKDE